MPSAIAAKTGGVDTLPRFPRLFPLFHNRATNLIARNRNFLTHGRACPPHSIVPLSPFNEDKSLYDDDLHTARVAGIVYEYSIGIVV